LTVSYVEIPQNYPFNNVLWQGSCDAGQLTVKVSLQHFELGKALRQIYVDKLGFLPNDVTAEEGKNCFMYEVQITKEL